MTFKMMKQQQSQPLQQHQQQRLTTFSSLLPCLKINHNKRKHNVYRCDGNIMFTFGVAIMATLLNLCCGMQYQPQLNNHRLLQAQQQQQPLTSSSLQLAKQWKLFKFHFLPHAPVNDMNFFNPSNILATGLAIAEDRYFLAMPKLFSGVPSTLNWISRTEYDESPVLQPYPDWSFTTTGRSDFNCSDLVLISVYRVRLDSCNRLWVLDAGISRSLEDYVKTCPPKILIFDLKSNRVVRRIDFPPGVLRGESLFTNLVIDETTATAGTCDDVFVYISDTVEPGIVVYDSIRDRTWRLTHPAMYPDPDFAEAEINNDRFVLMDGIVGITFDPQKALIYFQPFATDRIFSVTRDVLRAGPIAINQVLPVKLLGKKSSQGIGMAVTPDGTLVFSPSTETAVATWNPATNEQQVLAQSKEHLQFISDITTSPHDPGYVYVVSSKFHRFFLKNLNVNEANNRIVRLPVAGYAATLPTIPHSPFAPKAYGLHNNINSHYQLTNSIQPKITNTANYFTQSLPANRHPYTFENSGIVNFAVKNPFTALNQGESFPPRKELRNLGFTYLDSLAAGPSPLSSVAASSLLNAHPNGGSSSTGYYYTRGLRSVNAASS